MTGTGHNRAFQRPDQGEFNLHAAPRCQSCGKKTYPNRRLAKRALRIFYPASRGQDMHAYRCTSGGTGFHIGHRVPRRHRHLGDTR